MADISKIIYTPVDNIAKINSLELSSIQSVLTMGFGSIPEEWFQHFEGSNGFGCLSNCLWDGDSFNWDGPGMSLVVSFDATWQVGYRPSQCRITYQVGQGGTTTIYDSASNSIGSIFIAVGGPGQAIIDLTFLSNDINRIDMYGCDEITNIEFK